MSCPSLAQEFDGQKKKMAVARGLWSDLPPEKEYQFKDCNCCCTYGCCSGGGTQELKLYKDDIAWEATCPCPWPILAAVCTAYLYPINCVVFWCLEGKMFVRRKPYTKLNSVEVDYYNGACPDCCCPSTIFIKGFFGEHSCVPFVPMPIYMNRGGFKKVDEMASEVATKIALAEQKPAAAPSAVGANKFDPRTGQPIPKFDTQTGKQNW